MSSTKGEREKFKSGREALFNKAQRMQEDYGADVCLLIAHHGRWYGRRWRPEASKGHPRAGQARAHKERFRRQRNSLVGRAVRLTREFGAKVYIVSFRRGKWYRFKASPASVGAKQVPEGDEDAFRMDNGAIASQQKADRRKWLYYVVPPLELDTSPCRSCGHGPLMLCRWDRCGTDSD